MSDIYGLIFDIQRFSIHDGPGIRTTIFLKGCSNSCTWCHNPESISIMPELLYYAYRCKNCGNCIFACPNNCHILSGKKHILDRENCKRCGMCVKACYSNSLLLSGRIVNVDNIMEEVLADNEYYRQSNGGITLSGGEPVIQYRFCKELLKECKKSDIHTTIQTAGNYEYSWLKELLPFTDLVMYDIKAYSQIIYEQHIFGDRETILINLEKLAKENTPVVVRTPVIGPVNDNEQEILLIFKYLQRFKNIREYNLIPYHSLGDMKFHALDKNRKLGYYSPDADSIAKLREIAAKYGSI